MQNDRIGKKDSKRGEHLYRGLWRVKFVRRLICRCWCWIQSHPMYYRLDACHASNRCSLSWFTADSIK